jgi:collagenase-like PrtC family protease
MAADSFQVLSGASAGYYSHRCIIQRYENISNMLRLTWIRPEDLKYYTKTGINYFKLQGRQAVLKGDPVRAVEHYFNESFDGNLMELLDMFDPTTSFKVVIHNKKLDGFIEPFYKKENFCKNFCEACNYCETAARNCIDYEKARETIKAANMFYSQYDEFERLLEVITNPGNKMNDLLPAREIHRDEKDFNF